MAAGCIAANAIAAGADLRTQVEEMLLQGDSAQALLLARAAFQPEGAAAPTGAARQARLDLLLDVVIEDPALARDQPLAEWLVESEQAATAAWGPRSRRLAVPQALRADMQSRQGDLVAARSSAEAAVDMLDNGDGTSEPAAAAFVLATACHVAELQARLADAVAFCRRALAAIDNPHGALERLRYMRSAYFLATSESHDGQSRAAIGVIEQTLAATDRWGLAKANPRRSRLVGALAEMLIVGGDFERAQQLMLETLRHRDQLGVAEQAACIAHLAEAERNLGAPQAALAHYREAVALAEQVPTYKTSGTLAAILGNLANLEYELHDAVAGRADRQRGLQLLEAQFGADSPRLISAHIGAAEAEYSVGNFEGARTGFQRAVDIASGTLGVDHPLLAPAIHGLGLLQLIDGNAQAALPLFASSRERLTADSGSVHPTLLEWDCQAALATARNGDLDHAFASAAGIETRRLDLLTRLLPALSEARALELKRRLEGCQGLLIAIAARAPTAERLQQAWELVARSRGLATRLIGIRLASARMSADPEQRLRWTAWSDAADGYGRALLDGGDEIERARTEFDSAETALGAVPVDIRLDARSEQQLADRLREPPELLVAFVAVDAPRLEPGAHGLATGQRSVFAFVSDGSESRLHALGAEPAIDALVDRWLQAARNPASDSTLLESASANLLEQIWQPLGLRQPARVLLVADGALHRVSFAALQRESRYLVEDGWRFHQLDGERDLLGDAAAVGHRMVLLGAPQLAATADAGGDCGLPLPSLPGAQRELAAIGAVWRQTGNSAALVLQGAQATRSRLRGGLQDVGVLHIATHSVAIAPGCASRFSARDAGVRRGVGLSPSRNLIAAPNRDTLDAGVGLALASAPGKGNDLLLAQDVAALPLDRVAWVVLSACETAIGNEVADEGVFGLRRAFRLAGARTVIMSLWPIDDDATAEWMSGLYRARLQQHAAAIDAVADAQLRTLDARRARGLSVHPFYWAGFIAAGDWR